MDKYEYRIRAEEINALIDKKKFVEAVKIADTIDWRRVKSVMMLCKISELYKINRRYEDSKEILLLAYDRNPGSRKIVYSLCELSIKLEETVQAVEYYKEFVQIAPRDTGKFILQYRLYEAQDVSLEERIAVLEEYKKRDYREKWAYELAYLYHRIGLATRCVEECDELILWFGEGKYVIKAMELKMLHCPLTASQQEKYDRRFQTEEPVTEEHEESEKEQDTEESALPIEIKAVEPSNAPTAKIPSKNVEESLEEETAEEPEETEDDAQSYPEEAEAVNEEIPEEVEEEIPLTQPDDDLDIKVKTIDVDNEYSTINLQQELAKSLAKFMAEEDMVASDATMAMPFATLAEAATSDTIMDAITDDSIKNAIIAPLLQDTAELTPITEEDLLASMEENKESQPQEEAEEKPSMEDILTAETIQIPESVRKVPASVPTQISEEEKPDEITEQFVKALEEESVPIAPVERKEPEEGPVQSIPAEPIQLVEEPIQSISEEAIQPMEEPIQKIPAEPVQSVEEPVQNIPVEPVQSVEEPVQKTPEETIQSVEKPIQKISEETIQPVEEPVQDIPTEAIQSVEEPVQNIPEKPVQSVEEPVQKAPEEAIQPVEEPVQNIPAETIQPVEEPVQNIPVEPVQSVEEPVQKTPEETIQSVEKPIQKILEEAIQPMEEPIQKISAEPVQPVEEPVQKISAEPIQPVKEPVQKIPAEAIQSVEEPVQKTPAEAIQPVEEPVQKIPAEPMQPAEEPVQKIPAESVQSVEEPVQNIPVELIQPIEEPVQEISEEAIQPAKEPIQNISAEPVQPVEKPVQKIPAEAIQPTEEPMQTAPAAPARQVAASLAESQVEYSEPEEKPDDGQITGQLSLEDIMAEWEETKRANEERRMQEMRERVIQQTGPMFSNFDAMARASVQADLDLISPAEDVFNHDHLEEELKQKEMKKASAEPAEEEIEEIEEKVSEKAEPRSSVTFDTAEIFGLEEKLLDALNSPEIKEQSAPIEPIAIDSSFFEDAKEEAVEIEKEPTEKPLMQEQVTAFQKPSEISVPEPISAATESPAKVPVAEPAAAAIEIPVAEPTAAATEGPVEIPVAEPMSAATEGPVEIPVAKATAAAIESPVEIPAPKPMAAVMTESPMEAPAPKPTTVAAESPIEIPIPQEVKSEQDILIGKPVDLKSTDVIQTFVPKEKPVERPLTKEEKGRFASFAPNKEEQGKVARALDTMELSAATGNMLITGEHGTGTLQAAQNVVVQLKEKYPEFSGKMAKITGALLAEKNIGATLENLENSALLIEQAGDLPADALGNLLFHLDRLKEHKVFVIMEDTKKEMERLTLLYPDIAIRFNARIDIQSLDNDGLVNYAREYAKEQEYAIDDMGVLALYTKISDMQTNDHAVTVAEVKEMVDKAIIHAQKKNVSHFMDIILAKRYDGEDMIILREKDFLN